MRGNRALSRKEEGWERTESEERIVGANNDETKQPWAVGRAIGTESDMEMGDLEANRRYGANSETGDDTQRERKEREEGNIVKTVQINQYSI